MSRALVQIWDAPQCQTGAQSKGPLTTWQSARVSESESNPPQLVFTGVPMRELQAADASEGYCLKIFTTTRGVLWWVITDIADSDGRGSGLATVTCGPLLYLLGLRGLVRDGAQYSFTPSPDLRAIDHVRAYLLNTSPSSFATLPELAEDQLDWLQIGNIDHSGPLALPAFSKQTRLGVGRAIEQLSQCTLVPRPLVPDGSTGFALDLVRDLSAGLPRALYSVGTNVISAARARNVLRSPSVITPFGSGDQTLDVTEWAITAITGSGPYWITLRDPDPTQPWPIREDDQFIGAYLLLADGTTHAITDSRDRDSSVLVASSTGLTVGGRVGLARTTLGEPLREIVSPSMRASRGRVHAPLTQSSVIFPRNVVRDGMIQSWTDPLTPAHWSLIGGCEVVRYRRVENVGNAAYAVNGARSAGATSIDLAGGAPGARIYGTEVLEFAGSLNSRNVASGYTEFDGAGECTVTLLTGLAVGVANGSVCNARHNLSGSQATPKRPSWLAMPRNGDPEWALRFRSPSSSGSWPPTVGQDQARSAPFRVLYTNSSRDRVRAAAGFTVTAGNVSRGNLDAGFALTGDAGAIATRQLPGLILLSDPAGTPTLRGYGAVSAIVPVQSVVNEDVSCEYTITADTTMAIGLLPPARYSTGAGFFDFPFAICRWAAIWVGDEDEPPLGDGSRSNPPFHAAQDVLESVRGAARFRLTGVDLTQLLADGTPPALNQRVRFRSERLGVDAMVRLVAITWSLDDDTTFDAETGTPQPRITSVTVTL